MKVLTALEIINHINRLSNKLENDLAKILGNSDLRNEDKIKVLAELIKKQL